MTEALWRRQDYESVSRIVANTLMITAQTVTKIVTSVVSNR